jgi:ATP-dependent Clp protease adapter protein ClpS
MHGKAECRMMNAELVEMEVSRIERHGSPILHSPFTILHR